MNTNIKRGIVTGAISLTLLGGSAAGVVAQQGNQGGAAGLVAAVVQANLDDTTVKVIEIEDSLNNLRALNNFLNNSPITVTDVITIGDINVLTGDQLVALEDFLNDNQIAVSDVVAINVLSGGDLIVQTR